MRAVRLAVAAAGLATVGLAVSASAVTVPKPKSLVVTDPSGDALGTGGDDIVKVTYTSSGTTKKVGTRYVYTPKRLVMTLQTADAIADGDVQYNLEASLPGCSLYAYATPGSAAEDGTAFCSSSDLTGSATDLPLTVTTTAKTITFTIPLGAAPGFRAGAAVTDLYAYTGTVDPITGEGGPSLFGSTPLDNDQAESTGTYRIG